MESAKELLLAIGMLEEEVCKMEPALEKDSDTDAVRKYIQLCRALTDDRHEYYD